MPIVRVTLGTLSGAIAAFALFQFGPGHFGEADLFGIFLLPFGGAVAGGIGGTHGSVLGGIIAGGFAWLLSFLPWGLGAIPGLWEPIVLPIIGLVVAWITLQVMGLG